MNLATLIMFYLVASAGAQTCLTSSEEFATEVVIPDYNLARAQILGERLGSETVFSSQYNPTELLVVVSESSVPKGLAVRVQRPTEISEIERPHLKFTSYSLPGVVRTTNLAPVHYGWNIDCTTRDCVFEKDLMKITASREFPERGVTFEIDQDLPLCSQSCSGFCVTFAEQPRCFNAQIKTDMDVLLRYVNISASFQEAFNSYRLVGSEGITLRDITPISKRSLDWKEALREELVYLDAQGIIDVTKSDIEKIAALGREGQAGTNYRIVYDTVTSQWTYYDKTDDAVLSSERDCHAYDLPKNNPTITPGVPLDPYYLVPLIVAGGGITILVVLIIVARVVTSRTRRKHASRVHHEREVARKRSSTHKI